LKVEPVYKKFKGWNQDTSNIKNAEGLPEDMLMYIDYINQYIGVPVKYVSNGPGREQIIHI
ncbi:adenylosuccinate synthetase, partial [Acinetobacter baumannii]